MHSPARPSSLARVTALAVSALALLPLGANAQSDLQGWYAGLDVQQSRIERAAQTTLGDTWSIESNELRGFVAGLDSGERRDSDTGAQLHLGYLHALGDRWLLGAEFGVDTGSARVDASQGPLTFPGTAPVRPSYTSTAALEVDRMLVLRGLVGFRFGESQALYASVGAARADVLATTGLTSDGGYAKAGRFDGHRSGLQWGLGWRMALNERWSLRAEWLQTDLGDLTIENAYLPGSAFVDPPYSERYRIDVESRQLRVGVSLRF
jgi:opacity protein-like surface antigen